MDAARSLSRLAVALVVLAVVAARAHADVPARPSGPQSERLGKVSFPVSCGPAAQQDFDHAMALFHSFWYPQSIQAFTVLAGKYPDCAMAQWGTALSILRNPLGGYPMSAKD